MSSAKIIAAIKSGQANVGVESLAAVIVAISPIRVSSVLVIDAPRSGAIVTPESVSSIVREWPTAMSL
jgi:hypothetical protein